MLLAERARTARLEHILKLINRTTFGKRSEKLSADQLALALEDQAVALGEAQGLQDKTDEETERYGLRPRKRRPAGAERRSEEHTSELPSLMRIPYAAFCLEKKT